jgi:hypothetical protein
MKCALELGVEGVNEIPVILYPYAKASLRGRERSGKIVL